MSLFSIFTIPNVIVDVTVVEGDSPELVKVNERVWVTLGLSEEIATVALGQSKGADNGTVQQPLICWATRSSEVRML